MQKGLLVDWKTAGAMLAVGDDVDQAEFFKAFVNECLSRGTFPARVQLVRVCQKLDERDRRLLSMLGGEDGNE